MPLKILPLEPWMKNEKLRDPVLQHFWTETFPYYFRENQYLEEGVHTIEIYTEGMWKAYSNTQGPEQFKHKLDILNVKEYNRRQVEAMRTCDREGVATKRQREIVYLYDDYIIGARELAIGYKRRFIKLRRSLYERQP